VSERYLVETVVLVWCVLVCLACAWRTYCKFLGLFVFLLVVVGRGCYAQQQPRICISGCFLCSGPVLL